MSPAANRPPTAAPDASDRATARVKLPADDPTIFELDLAGLAARWGSAMERPPMSGEAMTGADRRAQALGVPASRLMEHAGTAVAAGVRALADRTGRWGSGPILVLCGPGNNGGDGFVAARRLARLGAPVVVGFVATEARPVGETSGRNWDRLAAEPNVTRMHVAGSRDLAILGQGIDRASVVVDALLGTGVRGALREPIRSAVDLVRRAHDAGVPVLAVDTPTAVDLTSGEATDPVVRADLTVTFHRPKVGLRTRRGAALAGRVLVAPIGIPAEADRG
jgi:ADP-dependent NAD(P)H-hydrate dehydratase / NAD(P)H-hydrate epimerase